MNQNLEHQSRNTALKTKAEIAEILAVSIRTIETWMRERKIPFIRIGKIVRFDSVHVMEHLRRSYENAAYSRPNGNYAALYKTTFEANSGNIENQASPASRVTNSA